MSVSIENQIESLLSGKPFECDDACETNQNEVYSSTEVNTTCNNYTPICQKTVTYIVVAIIINEHGEVLMMQEAKPSCKGKWYLPAGKVECNESLSDAVKREVLEEAGLVFEPNTLIQVESAGGSWFRFVFTGEIIGGNLKTLEEANEESLQAAWIQNVQDLELRSHDIVSLIEKGKSFIQNKKIAQHPILMPATQSLSKLLLQLVVTSKKKATNKLHILTTQTTPCRLPICEINPNRNLLSTLHSFMVEIFGSDVAQHKPHGLLLVEFSGGQGGDGLRLSLLVSFKLPLEQVSPIGRYTWKEISEKLATMITCRLPRNMTIPINVVR